VLENVSVVATDLDGTLLRRDGTISERTRAAMAAASDVGIEVVVVTARPFRFLQEIERLHVHGVAVCVNGALVMDLAKGTPVSSRLLDVEGASAAVAALREALGDVAFAVETVDWYGHEAQYRSEWPAPAGSPVAPVESLISGGVLKLLGRHHEIHVDRLAEIAALVGPGASVTCSMSSGLVEIGPAGVTKASALHEVVDGLGRSAGDVVAVGDMPNDLPMLRWAGTSAAVANAHPDLLAEVDRILPSNDDDGVATLLEQVVDLRSAAGSRPHP